MTFNRPNAQSVSRHSQKGVTSVERYGSTYHCRFQYYSAAINVPPFIGRIPGKFESGVSGFTADQLEAWTIIYSPLVLNGILPDNHYKVGSEFSLACALLCKPFITLAEVNEAAEHLMKFGIQFETIFGPEKVTPNMHLHGHLKKCVIDVGPVHSFWCFSFER